MLTLCEKILPQEIYDESDFYQPENGLFPEMTLKIITLIVSKNGKANKAKI